MTEFFVPGADAAVPDADEAAYRRLAELAGTIPAEPGDRIRLVAYRVGRESWTAEVGRTLSGTRPEHRRRKGEFTTTTEKLSGRATVLAIFAGTPFTVVTDGVTDDKRDVERDVDIATVDKPSRVLYFAD